LNPCCERQQQQQQQQQQPHLLSEAITQQLLAQRVLWQRSHSPLDALLRHRHLPRLQEPAANVPVPAARVI